MVAEVKFCWFIADFLVTEAGLAVVCRHLLAGLHTGVRLSQVEGDGGVLIAVLTLRADPGSVGLHYGQLVATTDTALRPRHHQVSPVTFQS